MKTPAKVRLWAEGILFGAVFSMGGVWAEAAAGPAPTPAPPPSVAEGAARIGSGDAAGAAKILEA